MSEGRLFATIDAMDKLNIASSQRMAAAQAANDAARMAAIQSNLNTAARINLARREKKEKENDERRYQERINLQGRRFDDHKKRMALDEKKIIAADKTNDLFERKAIRKKVIKNTKEAAKFAEDFAEHIKFWNKTPCSHFYCTKIDSKHKWSIDNCLLQAKIYRYYVERLEHELVAIKKDFKLKFEDIERNMSTNDAQIKAADATNDLLEKTRVRKDVIQKSEFSIEYLNEYIDQFCKSDKKAKKYWRIAKRYQDYQNSVQKSFIALNKEFKKKFPKIEQDMSKNDAQIKAADKTNNLNERKRVRVDVIGKSRNAQSHVETYINEFCKKDYKCDVNKYKKIAKEYRDYQYSVERDLPKIQEEIDRLKLIDEITKKKEKTHRDSIVSKIIEGIKNIEVMCYGFSKADINEFDNFLDLLIKNLVHLEAHSQSSDSVEKSYIVIAYPYKIEEFGVSMEVRELLNMDKDGRDKDVLNSLKAEPLTLRGINFIEATGRIMFAFDGKGRKLIMSTDLASIEKFVFEKQILAQEGVAHDSHQKVHLIVNPKKLSFWGFNSNDAERILSMVNDFVSLLNNSEDIEELFLERDEIIDEGGDQIILTDGLSLHSFDAR